MANSNKDKSSELEAQKQDDQAHGEGPFTPKQMRALKLLTGTMGVMIIICVILLGIGLSRQSAKLSENDGPSVIQLEKGAEIISITADGRDGIWLYSRSDAGEMIHYYKSSGKKGPSFVIARD